MENIMSEKNVWSTLKGINVKDKNMVETQNNLSYISWAKAWSALCDSYPQATMEKHCNEQGLPYFKDDSGWCFTKVTVSVGDKSITEILPVLNYANKPIQNPNSFEVNTSLQRCLAKAIALHGMGVQIYSGEDLQDGDTKEEEEDVTVFTSPDTVEHPFKIVSPTGEVKAGKNTVEQLLEIFQTFVVDCDNKESLHRFWKQNKVAVSLIEEKDTNLYKQLRASFDEQGEKIKKNGKWS